MTFYIDSFLDKKIFFGIVPNMKTKYLLLTNRTDVTFNNSRFMKYTN